ncbi:hypothetical protein QBC98_004735 [Kitasatospora acidiphila]
MAQLPPTDAEFVPSPVSLPPPYMWQLGRCVCCDRPTLVAPGPQITRDDGQVVTLPFCQVGYERAARYARKVEIRAQVRSGRDIA